MTEKNWGWSCTGLEGLPLTKVKNNVLIYGSQGPLKYLWANHFMMGNLMMGGNGAYITVTRKPDAIREDFKNYGFELSPYESKGRFYFVDLYPYFGKSSEEKFRANVKDSTLNHISLEISKALAEAKAEDGTLILDSVSSLMIYFRPGEVAKFVLEQAAKVSDAGWSSLFVVEKGTVDEQTERMLKAMLDGVYEIEYGKEHFAEFRALWIRGVLDSAMVKACDKRLVDHNICVRMMKK